MNPTENFLLTSLASLMLVDVEQLSITTPLDEQGVDSFVGLRFIRAIEKKTGVAISLKLFFDYPTVKDIAAFIDAKQALASA